MVQRRQLWIINAVLAGIAVVMAVRIRSDWKLGNERYAQLDRRSASAATPTVVPGTENPFTSVADVVSKNLFTPDRSSAQPQAVADQAAAPLPVVIGTMRLGSDYEALMSEAGGAGKQRFRRIKTGERVGPYTLVEIRDEAVVVEYQGQRTVLNVYQSAKAAIRAASNPAPATPRPSTAPVVETTTPSPTRPVSPVPAMTPPKNTKPDPNFMKGVKVTIEGNRKRFERWSVFGPQVWYEDIK